MREWLIQQRQKKKLTQKEVSSAVQVSQPTYWGYEHGVITPTVDTARRIGAFLGFKWTKFFDDK